ncbi:MAG TPA: ABC transporter ATP-binding protein [Glaciecola sp.]|nr:ABC transporter ATP-binding protein [Glaciecola sp.]
MRYKNNKNANGVILLIAIALKQLTFSYATTPIIDIDSLVIDNGERVFIAGPSGCGKSTLLNLISGTLTLPQKDDHITVLDQSYAQLTARQLDRFRAHNMGIVFQQFNLIGYLSVRENIALSTEFHPCNKTALLATIPALIAQLQLPAHIIDQPANTLSIGQQQRVAIARALIHKPSILIVDEPTSALDESATSSFMQTLLAMCDKHHTTLLFVSHDLRLANYFTRTIALNEINRVTHSEAR